jgi:hypothetical protein
MKRKNKMQVYINQQINSYKTNAINTTMNILLNGISKKVTFPSITAMAGLSALYMLDPQTLWSKLAVAGITLGGSYIATEGLHFAAGKIHQKAMHLFWQHAFKTLPDLPQKEKDEITKLLNYLDVDSILTQSKQI